MKIWQYSILFLIMGCLLLTAPSFYSTVYATTTTTCGSSPNNCFNGIEHDFGSAGVTSVYVDIYTPKTYPVNGTSSGTNAWPMIVSTNKYVQVGWIESNSQTGNNGSGTVSIPNGVHYFYEINYGTADGDYQIYNTYGPARGSTHGYRVYTSNSYWVGAVDDAQIGAFAQQIDTNKFLWSGSKVQFCEELNSGNGNAQKSAFAGTSTDHARFSNLRAFWNNATYYSPSATTVWLDTSAAQDRSHYGDTTKYTDQSQSYIDFWDTRY